MNPLIAMSPALEAPLLSHGKFVVLPAYLPERQVTLLRVAFHGERVRPLSPLLRDEASHAGGLVLVPATFPHLFCSKIIHLPILLPPQ